MKKMQLLLLAAVALLMFQSSVRSMTTSNTNAKRSIVLHWFRHGDLRLHDNTALTQSAAMISKLPDGCVLPIFVFDQKNFGANRFTPSGSLKCGPKRARFLSECVADLQQQLESNFGSTLLVAHGEPADIFDQLLSKLKDFDVHIVCQEEVVKEEKSSAKAVRSVLRKHFKNGKLHEIWGSTMYDLHGMPYEEGMRDMPDGFTSFRTKVEKKHTVIKPLPIPSKLPYPKGIQLDGTTNKMPTLQDLEYTEEQVQFALMVDPRSVLDFRGGETVALARVKEYIWDKDLLKDYFDTRNGMIGGDYSTKFSPWLAHGCLSPRHVVQECQRYEKQRVANKSTYWVVFELLWRDFCKFFAVKHGNAIFFPSGIVGGNKKWKTYEKNLEAWREGRTGYPLVDANMREMKATGFMSNRGRQNVASFLAIDLAYDWRCGGDWFESQLIDYDVYSNWVNWCAAAGMTGGRLNRFNIVKQSKDYDQHGEYVRLWLPELKDVPTALVHEPWKMTQFQQVEFNVRLGVDYPHPIVPPGGGGAAPGQSSQRPTPDRKPHTNARNRHQKYEMKSLKKGSYDFE